MYLEHLGTDVLEYVKLDGSGIMDYSTVDQVCARALSSSKILIFS